MDSRDYFTGSSGSKLLFLLVLIGMAEAGCELLGLAWGALT